MIVAFLGTGGSSVNSRRNNTSIAFVEDELLLVDCSGTPAQAIAQCGLSWKGLGHVVLTHRHIDHVFGLPSLVHQLFLDGRGQETAQLNIYACRETLEVARALLDAVGLLGRRGMMPINLVDLSIREQPLAVGTLSVSWFPVQHGPTETIGLAVQAGQSTEKLVVYSADTEPCANVRTEAARAVVLIHECSTFEDTTMQGHSTLAQVLAVAEQAPRALLRLVHLPACSIDDEQRATRLLQSRFGDRVALAADGLVLEV